VARASCRSECQPPHAGAPVRLAEPRLQRKAQARQAHRESLISSRRHRSAPRHRECHPSANRPRATPCPTAAPLKPPGRALVLDTAMKCALCQRPVFSLWPLTRTVGGERSNLMPKTRAQRTWLIGACLGKVDVVLIIGLSTPHGQPAHALIHRLRYYSEEPPRGDLAKLIQLFGRDRSLRVAHPNGKRYGQADLVAGHPFL